MTEDRHTPVPTAFPTQGKSKDPGWTNRKNRKNVTGKRQAAWAGKGAGLKMSFTQGKAGNARPLPPATSIPVPVLPARHRASSVTQAGAGAVLCPQRGITAWSCAVPTSPASAWALEPRRPECSCHARSELTQSRNVTTESPTCRRCCWGLARLCSCQLAGGNAEGDIHTHTSQRRGGGTGE